MKIKLVVGDWSRDGHEKTEDFWIESNLTSEEIIEAYNSGCDLIGFNLTRDVCAESEDSIIRVANIRLLIKSGFDWESFVGVSEIEDSYLYPQDFLSIYLFFVSKGNSDFKYQIVENDDSEIHVGGYGLFYCGT